MNALRRAPAVAVAVAMAMACRGRTPAPSADANSLIAAGDSLYARQAFDSATTFWRRSLSTAGVPGTPVAARLLTRLGLAAWRQSDLATARKLGDSALSLKHELGMLPGDLAESENALGLLAWDENRLEDASGHLARALTGFRAAGNRSGVAKVLANTALVDIEYGRYSDARRALDTAIAIDHAANDGRLEGRALNSLGIVETQAGDPHVALNRFAEARRLALLAHDDITLENTLGQLGVVWALLGDAGRAIASVDSALAVARDRDMGEQEANDLLLLGSIYRDAGDLDRALQNYDSARVLSDRIGLPDELGIAVREMAALRVARGGRARARADLIRALHLHRDGSARLQEFNDLLALASIEIDGGDAGLAERHLAEATTLAAELDAPQVRSDLALARARLALRRSEPRAALALLAPVVGQLALGAGTAAVEGEWLRTRAFAALGRLDSAVAAGRRAVATIERTRNSLASPALRTSLTADRSEVFADLVLALLRVGDVDEAFTVADAARGRVLLDYLAGARAGIRRSVVERDLAERERLLREIDALVARLQSLRSTPRRERGVDADTQGNALERRLGEVRAAYEALLIQLSEQEPVRTAIAGTRDASAHSVRGALHDHEALLEYFVTPDELIVFVMTRDGMRAVRRTISAADLENRVRLVRALMGEREGTERAQPALVSLYATLVQPVMTSGALRGVRHLIVVPHGVLSYLPFAALKDSAARRPLIEDFNIEYVPVAEALPSLRGAVVTHSGSEQLTAFAPFPAELGASGAEAAAVARAWPNARVVSGSHATESAFRRALAEGGIVHVATHGIMTPANPMFSSIQLATGDRRAASDDDGRLEVHELLPLTSSSPLVFLSGCETALGAARGNFFARAEDYATLAQAFLFTGVRGVIATLWRIDDAGAARFAERFYAHLASESAAEALAAAQRDMRADPRWSSPYYWAPYILSGDGPGRSVQNAEATSVSP